MKKSLSMILAIIIIFNMLLPSYIYATGSSGSESKTETYNPQSWLDVEKGGIQNFDTLTKDDESSATVNGRKEKLTETATTNITLMGTAMRILCLIPQSIQLVLSLATTGYVIGSTSGSSSFHWFSIHDTVFGKISLFDINFFDNTGASSSGNANLIIKQQVAGWFYAMRTIAMIGSLVVLIYVGIRMAISTIAEDQAKYKQMIMNWLTSFIILFILPYVLIFTFNIADSMIKLIPEQSKSSTFEETINKKVTTDLVSESIMPAVGAFALMVVLTYYQVIFFFKYMLRLLKAAFLVIISPLITITYALDKGKAHKTWFKQYIGVIFMQVIHALIYSIFMYSAGEIATRAPIIAIAFFMALSRGEKIFNYLFDLDVD